MIPIGTRCVIVGGVESGFVGMTCVVIAHASPAFDRRADHHKVRLDHEPEWARERWDEFFFSYRHLIPIGHDPDAEELRLDVEFPCGTVPA